jgi:amino acid transporter
MEYIELETLDDTSDESKIPTLPKSLGLKEGLSLIVGSIIGSGIFSSPGMVLKNTSSISDCLLVWLFAGLLSVTGGLCYMELGCIFPNSGGDQIYLFHAYGPIVSFIYVWTSVLMIRPASLAIQLLTCGQYISKDSQLIIAALIGLLLTIVNAFSTVSSHRISVFFTVLKLLSIFGIIVCAIITVMKGFSLQNDPNPNSENNIGAALFAALWAYDGWNNLNFVTGELHNPTKNLPRSILGGLAIVIFCYLFTNLSYFAVLPVNVMQNSSAIAVDFALTAIGKLGAIIVAAFVVLSTVGACNASMFAGSRLAFVAAEKYGPSFITIVNQSTKTPVNALIAQTFLTLLFISIGDFAFLLTIFSITAWIFYLLTVFGILLLRISHPAEKRPVKVWIAAPISFSICCIFMLSQSAFTNPKEFACSILFICSGIPVYLILKR